MGVTRLGIPRYRPRMKTTTKLALLALALVLLASTAAGWKWGGAANKTAGFSWDESSSQYS